MVAVSIILYASSWYEYVTTPGGREKLVDNDVSTIAHSELLIIRNTALFRASQTKVPTLKDEARHEFEKGGTDERSW